MIVFKMRVILVAKWGILLLELLDLGFRKEIELGGRNLWVANLLIVKVMDGRIKGKQGKLEDSQERSKQSLKVSVIADKRRRNKQARLWKSG